MLRIVPGSNIATWKVVLRHQTTIVFVSKHHKARLAVCAHYTNTTRRHFLVQMDAACPTKSIMAHPHYNVLAWSFALHAVVVAAPRHVGTNALGTIDAVPVCPKPTNVTCQTTNERQCNETGRYGVMRRGCDGLLG